MPDTTADPVAAELGYLKACIPAIVASPQAFDLAVILPRIGRAVAAVEAALKVHHDESYSDCAVCKEYCDCYDGDLITTEDWGRAAMDCPHGSATWPCATVRAIHSALLGEDAPSDG